MPETAVRILFLPELRRGHGIGHIVRSAQLASRISGAALVLPDPEAWNPTLHPRDHVVRIAAAVSPGLPIVPDTSRASTDLLVLDRREVSIADMERFLEQGPVIGLDLGGAGRALASLLVDCIDRWQAHDPNLRRVDLLPLPRRKRSAPPRYRNPRVLVSLGGEDPADAGPGITTALRKAGYKVDSRSPVLRTAGSFDPGLPERLADYDVVITGFGLTALQARSAGCRVFVIPLTGYHRRLARGWGFASADNARTLLRELGKPGPDLPPSGTGEASLLDGTTDPESGPTWLASLVPRGPFRCPVCETPGGTVIGRYPDRTYRRCPDCGMLWMSYLGDAPMSYGPDYFGREYREQYGRSYLEDFSAIEARGRDRLDWIAEVRGPVPAGSRILDLGCAYGPFLQAASGLGLRPYGVDVSAESVAYVRDQLGIPCVRGSVETFQPQDSFGISTFDMVTMWYVIEHLPDVGAALSRIHAMISPGGLLAFATPSGSGISARRDRDAFLARSPRDHFTVWEPRRSAAILRRFGFRLLAWRNTGHHPERFGASAGPVRTRLRLTASQWFRLGDTFEVIAERVG